MVRKLAGAVLAVALVLGTYGLVTACEITAASATCNEWKDCNNNIHLLWTVDADPCTYLGSTIERKCGNGNYTQIASNAFAPFDDCVDNVPCVSGSWTYRITAHCRCGEKPVDSVQYVVGPISCP